MSELVRYDAMCRAIAEAHAVDEVKDIRDKARAIEMYARQAQNHEAERQAIQIRARAERRCGELTREMVTAQGVRSDLTSHHDDTKSEAGNGSPPFLRRISRRILPTRRGRPRPRA